MAIVYEERPELMMSSKQVRNLYFKALAMKEAMEELLMEEGGMLGADIEQAFYELSTALEDYQGEELTPSNGSDNQD